MKQEKSKDFKNNFDKEFDEKFHPRSTSEFTGNYPTYLKEIKQFIQSQIEKQETKLLCEFQDTEMKWKRQLEEAKQKQIEECLEIINHSIDKNSAYKEISKLLK